MPNYPKRDQFYAHKFVRLALRSCIANEIGSDGVLLLVVIAHTEDAKRYRAPVTFWNDQLIPLLGINTRKQLSRIRDKCVAAGWLHYERDSRRHVGRYWTMIPPQYVDMEDTDFSCDAELLAGSCVKNDPRTAHEGVHEQVHEPHMKGYMNRTPSTLSLSLSLSETETETETETEGGAEKNHKNPSQDYRDIASLRAMPIQPLPLGKVNQSAVFDALTPEMLMVPSQVVSWFRRQLSASKPVLEPNAADLLLALCAARRATGKGIEKPVGSFVSLVTKRNWKGVERYRGEFEATVLQIVETNGVPAT